MRPRLGRMLAAALLLGSLLVGWSGAAPRTAAAGSPAFGVGVEPTPYDLTRVVSRALSHHYGVRLSRLQAEIVRRQGTSRRAAIRPSLSVTATPNWFETPVPDFDALELDIDGDRLRDLLDDCLLDADKCDDLLDELEDGWRSVAEQLADGVPEKLQAGRGHTVAVNGATPLWTSPLQQAVADAARWQEARADVAVDEAAAGAILQSMDAYFGVLQAEAAARVAGLALEEASARVAEAEDRLQAGTATTIDRLQAEAERHGAEARWLQAQGEVTAARMLLNSVLGFDLNVPLQLAAPPVGGADGTPSGPADPWSADRNEDVRKAYIDWRLADAAAVAAEEQAKPQVRLFASGQWPEVEVNLGVDRHGYLGGGATWNQTFLEGERVEADGLASWFAGFEVTWDVFDGGKARAEAEAARLQARQAELHHEYVVQTARTEVLAAYARWQAAEEALTGVERGVEAAGQGVDVALQLAASGAATDVAVLQARLGLARAEQAHLDALYGAVMAHAAYLHAAGELVPYWQGVVGFR